MLEEKPAPETTKTTTVLVAQNLAKTDSATADKKLASVSKVALTDGAAGATGAAGAGGAGDAGAAGMLPTTGGHIMISYQWASKPTMLRVRDKLMQAGYRVWMDVDNMCE